MVANVEHHNSITPCRRSHMVSYAWSCRCKDFKTGKGISAAQHPALRLCPTAWPAPPADPDFGGHKQDNAFW